MRILLLVVCVFFASCEGYRCAEGYIYDTATHAPLDSVWCRVLTGSENGFSDSTGQYSVCNPFGSCMPDCPDIWVEFSKDGYKMKTLKNPSYTAIFLEKE